MINARKDEKAQVYYTEVKQSGSTELKYRHFIYTKAVHDNGGLYVNARDFSSKEKVDNQIAYSMNITHFRFNRNKKITSDCKIIYRNNVYDIDSIDEIDFRGKEMKVIAKKSNDKTKYKGDLYEQ